MYIPRLKEKVSLLPYNTFGIEAYADWMIAVQSEEEASAFVVENIEAQRSTWILGGGSNILFTQDFHGVVLKNEIMGREVIHENESEVIVRLGAGENWHEVVLHFIEQGWGGIENLSLIPGCVGAAPIQNIGAYGVEIKDVLEKVETIHLTTGRPRIFSVADCELGYRESFFKRAGKGKFLVTRVVLRLQKKPTFNTQYGAIGEELEKMGEPISLRSVSQAIINIRQSKLPDPAVVGNAGSFFKNPVVDSSLFEKIFAQYPDMPHYEQPDGGTKIPAAWLIQTCGWKGKRFGEYGVHPNQALVLVNYGNAKGQEIFDLSQQILESVQATFGIELEREVNVL